MRIELDFSKSIEQNANLFFEKAKKAKKKLLGVRTAAKQVALRLDSARQKDAQELQKRRVFKKRKKDWFEKFHWMHTMEGLLVIGGRDAKSNEQIIKKYFAPTDLFFHADIAGAPHCVLKTKNKKPSEQSLREAAQFAAVFSKAWAQGVSQVDVYAASFEQVSKSAPSGVAMKTGAFMVYGKRQWFKNVALVFAVGLEKAGGAYRASSGSLGVIKKNCLVWAEIRPGNASKSVVAKQLFKLFAFKTKTDLSPLILDELLCVLPNGQTRVTITRRL